MILNYGFAKKHGGCLSVALAICLLAIVGRLLGYDKDSNERINNFESEQIVTEATVAETVTTLETTTTEETSETVAPTDISTETSTMVIETEMENDSNSDSIIRPEIKEAIDSYESFVDEYIAFLKKMDDNSEDMNVLMDYMNYLQKLTEYEEKFTKLENEDMTAAESLYYSEVAVRCNQKMLAATSDLS